MRRSRLTSLLLMLLTFAGVGHAAESARRVNFLIITADDMNWDSVGCND